MVTAAAERPATAVVYTRISQDATGEAAGVERQRQDCLRYCAGRGWTVVAQLEDNDISASRYSTKKRPAYGEALRMIETGEAAALVAWHLDRLWRQPKELEHLIDLAEHKAVTVATLNGDIDLTTGDGRFTARILVSVAAKSSDDLSRRILRKMAANADDGRPHGGHRSFGYEPGNTVPNKDGSGYEPANTVVRPDEAALIRQAAADLLAGESLGAIAARWNEAGVSTPQRGKWWGASVGRLMAGGRIAGLRVHQGEIVGPAAWPAIIDRPTHEALVALLADKSRRLANPPRRSLLAGMVRCGLCGETMTRNTSVGTQSFRCAKRPGCDNCGRLNVTALPMEALIVESVLAALDTGDLADAIGRATTETAADRPTDELAAIEARLGDLADMFAADAIGRAEWLRARKGLEARQQAARGALRRDRRTLALDPYTGRPGALRAAWPTMTLDQRRTVVGAVIDRITVRPSTRQGPTFDPSRIEITWRA